MSGEPANPTFAQDSYRIIPFLAAGKTICWLALVALSMAVVTCIPATEKPQSTPLPQRNVSQIPVLETDESLQVTSTPVSAIESPPTPTEFNETTPTPPVSNTGELPDIAISPTTNIKSPQSQLEEIVLNMYGDKYTEAVDALSKIDSSLQSLLIYYLLGENISTIAVQQDITLSDNNEVLVDIYLKDNVQSVIGDYQLAGMNILATNDAYNIIEGWLPVSSVLDVAILEHTKAIVPVVGFGTDN